MSAEQMERSMYNTRVNSNKAEKIPAHYIVGCSGDFLKTNELERVVGATQSGYANWNGIHIEIVGDFTKHKPTEEQYKTTRQLIAWIHEKHPGIEVRKHNDFGKTSCPGHLFDMGELTLKKSYLGVYQITQYHPGYGSPINDNAAQGGSFDVTASGLPLQNDYAGKVAACPPELPIGRGSEKRAVLYIEGLGEVECVDRGGMIKGNKIDLFVGLGEVGHKNRMSQKFLKVGDGNMRKVYLLREYVVK